MRTLSLLMVLALALPAWGQDARTALALAQAELELSKAKSQGPVPCDSQSGKMQKCKCPCACGCCEGKACTCAPGSCPCKCGCCDQGKACDCCDCKPCDCGKKAAQTKKTGWVKKDPFAYKYDQDGKLVAAWNYDYQTYWTSVDNGDTWSETRAPWLPVTDPLAHAPVTQVPAMPFQPMPRPMIPMMGGGFGGGMMMGGFGGGRCGPGG